MITKIIKYGSRGLYTSVVIRGTKGILFFKMGIFFVEELKVGSDGSWMTIKCILIVNYSYRNVYI